MPHRILECQTRLGSQSRWFTAGLGVPDTVKGRGLAAIRSLPSLGSRNVWGCPIPVSQREIFGGDFSGTCPALEKRLKDCGLSIASLKLEPVAPPSERTRCSDTVLPAPRALSPHAESGTDTAGISDIQRQPLPSKTGIKANRERQLGGGVGYTGSRRFF